MTTWLSTHGIGAIKDSNSSFSITAENGVALIHPTSANDKSGWIHFTIPSPPADNPNLRAVTARFSTSSATVDKVRVFLGNNTAYSRDSTQETDSFTYGISSTSETVYKDLGIAVSIWVDFDSVTAKLKIQSVGVQV